jgi:hypothetical protein
VALARVYGLDVEFFHPRRALERDQPAVRQQVSTLGPVQVSEAA